MRPTRLTSQVRQAIVNTLRLGGTRRDAALLAGISESTLYNWLAWGRKDHEAGRRTRYVEFLESVERAEAEARQRMVAIIQKAAVEGDWRAALEYLRRRDRQHWGDQIDVTSAGQAIQFVVKVRGDGDGGD